MNDQASVAQQMESVAPWVDTNIIMDGICILLTGDYSLGTRPDVMTPHMIKLIFLMISSLLSQLMVSGLMFCRGGWENILILTSAGGS